MQNNLPDKHRLCALLCSALLCSALNRAKICDFFLCSDRNPKVAETVNADVFFAKPYASYQRGTNENTNGIIRRTYPKKMALGHLTREEIGTVELLINTMPRKVLGGRTPLEVYTGKLLALIA